MSESTNKAEQRESGWYWVNFQGKWLLSEYRAEDDDMFAHWFLYGSRTDSTAFDEIDERPIQRHQPEVILECLEVMEKNTKKLHHLNSYYKENQLGNIMLKAIIERNESCISKLKSLI